MLGAPGIRPTKGLFDVSMSSTTTPRMSIILPTRERGYYLEYALRSCTRTPIESVEIVVIDNASTDNTREIVAQCTDRRVRYVRTEQRLSMRDNFERGLDEARGEVICMLGDDDGILPSAVERVLTWMEQPNLFAAMAHRAYYGWPDLQSGRRGIGLVPRASGDRILSSRSELRGLLDHADYYRLPCLYHGFVRRGPVERIRARQGRFFLSNNTDIYSSIALAMEGLDYVYSAEPLIVNGGSARSNGASHYGGAPAREKELWIKEDELGFLPGYENTIAVDAAIVETGIRYCQANGTTLSDLFDATSLRRCLGREVQRRERAGRPDRANELMLIGAGLTRADIAGIAPPHANRTVDLARAFGRTMPVDLKTIGVKDVDAAAIEIDRLVREHRTGILRHPLRQMRAAANLASGG